MAKQEDYLKNMKWIERIDELFDRLDNKKDGYITRKNWMNHADYLAEAVPDRPAEVAKFREYYESYCDLLGFKEGLRADKKKFRELTSAVVAREALNKKEETTLYKHHNAFFDVVDHNHDGTITWDEYKVALGAGNFGHIYKSEEHGRAVFDTMDKNKDGKIERDEFITTQLKFWYELED